MTEPPGEVGDGRAHVRRPVLVAVLPLERWKALGNLRRRRSKRHAVSEIGSAIAEREELAAKLVGSAKRIKDECSTLENALDAVAPTRGQHVAELRRAVVEPIIDELDAHLALRLCKLADGVDDDHRDLGHEDGEVPRRPLDDPHQAKRRSTDDDPLEAQA